MLSLKCVHHAAIDCKMIYHNYGRETAYSVNKFGDLLHVKSTEIQTLYFPRKNGYIAFTSACIKIQKIGNPIQAFDYPNWFRTRNHTIYPKKFAHGFVVLCFVVVTQSFIMNSHEVFIHIHQGCFAGTGAIVRLPQCQWSKPGGYGKISQCITTTKHSKAKAVCIFLGIYCISYMLHPSLIMLFLLFIDIIHVIKRECNNGFKADCFCCKARGFICMVNRISQKCWCIRNHRQTSYQAMGTTQQRHSKLPNFDIYDK